MWQNYLITSFRYLWRFRLYTFINLAGLSIGITLGTLIFLFIMDELSFDQFHSKKEFLYRMEIKRYSYTEEKNIFDSDQDGIWQIAWMPTPLGPAIKNEIPDIVGCTRWESGSGILTYNDKIFEESVNYIDQDFFRMFDFRLITGDSKTVLKDKSQIVLTESIKKKYFDQKDPIGEVVYMEINSELLSFIVSGIIEDPPANSSLNYNLLIRQENRPQYEESIDSWQSYNCPTFIEIRPETDYKAFHKRLRNFENRYFDKEKDEVRGREMLVEDEPVLELKVKPFTKIHLDPEIAWYKSSDPKYSFILGGIGILILLIASVNYISLSMSNSTVRTREVGIRKVMGASHSNLARQFWAESIMLVSLAILISILLTGLIIDFFNVMTEKSLSLFHMNALGFLAFLVLLGIVISFVAGGYPAIFMSRFQPIKVLKSGNKTRFNTYLLRVLVILQYSLSTFLIISSLIMYYQMMYITTKDLGFDKDQVLVIPTFTGWTDQGEKVVNRLMQALQGVPGVIHVSGTSASFCKGWSRNGFQIEGVEHSAFTYRIHGDYIKALGLEIIQGRNFDPDHATDRKDAIIVNEALVKHFGWKKPLDQHLYWRNDSTSFQIIGIVKNYHFLSLESEIEPVILYSNPDIGKVTTALIKIDNQNIPETIAAISKTWNSIFTDRPFEYSFLDADVSRQYGNYSRWMRIMTTSTILAIFIASLGLFGLSGINAINRTCEISIRKVFGASLSQLFMLMNRDVIIMSFLSFIVAMPVSYMVMQKWLNYFHYRVEITASVFFVAILTGMFVALLTVSYHALKVSLVNPAKVLNED